MKWLMNHKRILNSLVHCFHLKGIYSRRRTVVVLLVYVFILIRVWSSCNTPSIVYRVHNILSKIRFLMHARWTLSFVSSKGRQLSRVVKRIKCKSVIVIGYRLFSENVVRLCATVAAASVLLSQSWDSSLMFEYVIIATPPFLIRSK